MLNRAKVRLVSIGYPTKEAAERYGLDFATYETMHWDAVNADYGRIAEQGAKIKKALQGAKMVKVTSANGTNFSFSVGSRTIFADDGIVTAKKAKSNIFLERITSLPGGSVFFAPLETSANGKVAVPRTRCRFDPMTGVTFEFKNGKLENFKADTGGKCFEEVMAPYTGPKDMFGYFSVGLNPALKVMENPGDYRPGDAAGMVWIGVGDNILMGGKNKTQGSMEFPIVKATVEIDGKVVVKDGELVF
jgi:aminopeptidase